MRKSVLSLSLVTAIGLGSLVGCSSPEPKVITKTVTVTQPPKIVTKTVTREVVPPVCLQALDDAEELFKIAGEFAQVASKYPGLIVQGEQAALNLDVDGIEAVTDKVQKISDETARLTGQVKASDYEEHATVCRSK